MKGRGRKKEKGGKQASSPEPDGPFVSLTVNRRATAVGRKEKKRRKKKGPKKRRRSKEKKGKPGDRNLSPGYSCFPRSSHL